MKRIYLLSINLVLCLPIFGQLKISGKVTDSFNGKSLSESTIRILNSAQQARTDEQGMFMLTLAAGANHHLVVSHIGYKTDTLLLEEALSSQFLLIGLEPAELLLSEVVISTGYQQFSKTQSPGAVTYVGSELLNRSMSSDIISRLEGVSGPLAFNRRDNTREESRSPELRIRGTSTLHGQSGPLIIVDNFPFEGDISSINPNDVKDVTLLKDAAAASIWGAKAGNGVLVITTKKGGFNTAPKVLFNSNITISSRPDLYRNPNFLDSENYINVERELFNRGFYVRNNITTLSPAVELLFEDPNAKLEHLQGIDYRADASKLFYKPAVRQQYFLSINGGTSNMKYYFSGGYDKMKESIRYNGSNRLTINTSTTYSPLKNLEIEAGLNFVRTTTANNGLGITQMLASGKTGMLPYTRFWDQQGSPLGINRAYNLGYVAGAVENNLLDWQYRPLQESGLNNHQGESGENRLNFNASYQLFPGFRLEGRYQYHLINQNNSNDYNADSYYVRDLVNRYTQQNGLRIIPPGNILSGTGRKSTHGSLRSQFTYNKTFRNGDHDLNAVAGYERRQVRTESAPGYQIFGVDSETLVGQNRFDYLTWFPTRPQGSSTVPAPVAIAGSLTDRFVSYYSSAVYSFRKKYMFSSSVRQDGSNLYGVKFRQKVVPLWSAGAAWTISEENFFQAQWLEYLKVRTTYGFSGNLDKSTTAFPIVNYGIDSQLGLTRAFLRNAGNPSLKWEKVKTINAGVDFSIFKRKLTGSLDFYTKRGLDLIGDVEIDPTTGIGFPPAQGPDLTNRINYASTTTKGWDVELNSQNVAGKLMVATTLLFNYVKNVVTDYNNPPNSNILIYTVAGGGIPPVKGNPLDAVYSFKWHGLDPATGAPLVEVEGNKSLDYGKYINQLTPEQLILHGSSVPRFAGSLRNVLTYRNFSLGFILSWKANYFYREGSINYNLLFNQWQGHPDFNLRWQKPGDEAWTNVPSMPTKESYDPSGRRDMLYSRSELLAFRGDHIRLQEVTLSYRISTSKIRAFKSISFNVYANNLGIVWRKQKGGSDPDFPNAFYPPVKSISTGVQLEF